MKINIFNYIIIVSILLTSCKGDFLEVTPKGKAIAITTDDYDYILNTDLSYIHTDFNEFLASSVLGDEMTSIESYFDNSSFRFKKIFQYDKNFYNVDENSYELNNPLKHLYIYNKVINEVLDAEGNDLKKKKSLQAEAKVGRAWIYFYIINFYAKQYNKESAATDPGFPIITENNVFRTEFKKNSVKEVYEFILNDLNTAIVDVPEVTTNRFRASKKACAGLLAQVYTYMGEYEKAIPYLDIALQHQHTAIKLDLIHYNEVATPYGYFFPSDKDHTENIYIKASMNPAFLSDNLLITPETMSYYTASDLRLGTFVSGDFISNYPVGIHRRSELITYYIGVNLPELYLLRAECLARTNYLEKAIQDIEYLRSKRIEDLAEVKIPITVAKNKAELIKYVFEERLREFAGLGYRWFDMRRIVEDPIFNNQKFSHKIYTDAGEVKVTYDVDKNNMFINLPSKILAQTPSLK